MRCNRLSLESRFKRFVYTEDIRKLQAAGQPKNTKKDTSWSVGAYNAWRVNRNQSATPSPGVGEVPILSSEISTADLNYWLSHFVLEVNRVDGSPYPAVTIKHLCVGIQRFLREECDRPEISLFDGLEFVSFRKTLDARMKEVNRLGIGTHKKQAQPLSTDEEAKFWDQHVFNWISGKGLSNALYFYTSKFQFLILCLNFLGILQTIFF